jgi:hypothetical protein
VREKFKSCAEEKVRRISKSEEEKPDMYLVNSSLRTVDPRKEDLTVAEREVYAKKEQEDRRRFGAKTTRLPVDTVPICTCTESWVKRALPMKTGKKVMPRKRLRGDAEAAHENAQYHRQLSCHG